MDFKGRHTTHTFLFFVYYILFTFARVSAES